MRVLVADDDPVTRRLLEAQLQKWGHEVIVCADGSCAWRLLSAENAPRLIILDWMMPGIDGVNICREIRKLEQQPYKYLILLTSKSRQDEVIEGLEAGADDYITKPFNPNELKVRIRTGARIVQLHEELTLALEKSRFQASHDSLTSLFNRTAIFQALHSELERSRRESTKLSVILADIDHFKHINDGYGHLAGDAVLKELAKRIASSLRMYDSVGRYGGEEFVIILPGCDEQEARNAAERIRSCIADKPIVTSAGEISCTLSLGVTSAPGTSVKNMDQMLKKADEALYHAKNCGRNRVELCI
ncbi:diguanylate cyclase [Desulfomonile tiedjei]|uniref:diguanylate cyclase n=1 Tax=Desulfomonile tiedjei (strain ATCC 49306 / DSM 6799 / DCB-1) TaxID=706587 RepID=I4C0U4_DESTA|nr:diguanylate cyclase [Desulfomonile tiedjei]AFM23185.1 diguanylate cyclase (GGDEF) domain-containing protein [Desulfomonile tiedjei DSM 6799]